MIVMTTFFSVLNQMEIHLVQNLKENCHHDHIPFNVKGEGKYSFLSESPQTANVIFLAGASHMPQKLLYNSSSEIKAVEKKIRAYNNKFP